ncbi:hypothetical protein ACHAXT_009704 [Thalassiosira profunda]
MPLSKPFSIVAQRDPDEEEAAALVPGRRRGPRLLGAQTAEDGAPTGASALLSSKWRWALLAFALVLLRSAYKMGVEVGIAEEDVDEAADLEAKPAKKKKWGFGIGKSNNGRGRGQATPSPTRAETPPPVPTYKPTEAEGEATARPTFDQNASWVDPVENPYIAQFNTSDWIAFHAAQWKDRAANAVSIRENYGGYCPKDPAVPMCPKLDIKKENDDDGKAVEAKVMAAVRSMSADALGKGPTVKCIDTGGKAERCGVGNPWLNKTIWPLIRGPYCAKQDAAREEKHPLPQELAPYFELGYNREDPTQSTDAFAFDGGSAKNNLPFDPEVATDHFLKFEAMLDHYYQGVSRSYLERNIAPKPENPLYGPMLQAYADQIARAVLRAKEGTDDALVFGILGDSVTAGQDNCYYDAWPEQMRRQITPLFAAMGLKVQVRNAAKNGGWNLAPQMLCAHDMLGASDREGLGLDFLFQCNPFVKAGAVDAEHMVRRALLGDSHTIVSVTLQDGMNADEMLERYAAAGLTIGTPYGQAAPEIGYPEKGHKYWFPANDRAFWGMQGDGFCHLTTRAGSSAVVNRNWHWGPKAHQTYADGYSLLLSRAARHAIEDLAAGRTPADPRRPRDLDAVLTSPNSPGKKKKNAEEEDKDAWRENPPSFRHFLYLDMAESEEAIDGGIGGVRCAVGSANQPGSQLLPNWIRPAEGSPFEEKMKARKGISYFQEENDKFWGRQSPISSPNGAVGVGGWVAKPTSFGAEAPRTAEQCKHADGKTMVNKQKPESVSWLVWEIPKGAVNLGRAMMCHPRGTDAIAEDAFDKGDVRVHYAVPDGKGGFKVAEDAHKAKKVNTSQDCMPMIGEMNDDDRKAAKEGGMWVAVEWKPEGVFDFDYLVAV